MLVYQRLKIPVKMEMIIHQYGFIIHLLAMKHEDPFLRQTIQIWARLTTIMNH